MNGYSLNVKFAVMSLVMPVATPLAAQQPRFLTEKRMDCASFSLAINHYVDLGPEQSIRELKSIAEGRRDLESSISLDERIAFLCRVLFDPTLDRLNGHRFGGIAAIDGHAPISDWPLSPLVKSGNTYFIIPSGFSVIGLPESIEDYIDYCVQTGSFLRVPTIVPTRESATMDIESLRDSARWNRIEWESKDGFVSRDWVWKAMLNQARSVSDNPSR